MAVKEQVTLPAQRVCTRCKFVSSQEVCKACVLLEGLNKGLPKLGIGKSSKAKKMLEEYNAKQSNNVDKAINDINEECKLNNCVSKGKMCRANRNKDKNKNENKSNEANKNESTKCCNGKCTDKLDSDSQNDNVITLLVEYGIPQNIDKAEIDNKVNAEQEKNGATEISDANKNGEFIDLDTDEEKILKDEDNTCAGACGKLDSLHLSF